MQPQQAYAARSRRAGERNLTQRTLVQAPPHKERALWNFLTWSFFIAQVLAAEQFIGAQAKAAESPDLGTPDPTAAMATPPLEALAALDGAGSSAESLPSSPGTSLDDVFGQPLELGQFDGSVIDLDSITTQRVEGVAQSISVGGVSSGPSSPGDTAAGLVPDTIVDGVIPDLLDVIGDATGPLLDSVENIVVALTGLVGGVAGPLLGTVGGVVHALDDVVHDVVSLPVRLLHGVDDLAATTQGLLASAGQLSFPVLGLVGELNELISNGHYTEYGIELQSGLPGAAVTAAIDPVTSAATAAVDVVDHIVDTAVRPLTHLLDDLGSRDGLL